VPKEKRGSDWPTRKPAGSEIDWHESWMSPPIRFGKMFIVCSIAYVAQFGSG
jgi:hypothetical protein